MLYLISYLFNHFQLNPQQAVRRRFDVELEVTSPTLDDRVELLSRGCHKFTQLKPIDAETITNVAEAAHGYTGLVITNYCMLHNFYSAYLVNNTPTLARIRYG